MRYINLRFTYLLTYLYFAADGLSPPLIKFLWWAP